jgi:hypothetical protein
MPPPFNSESCQIQATYEADKCMAVRDQRIIDICFSDDTSDLEALKKCIMYIDKKQAHCFDVASQGQDTCNATPENGYSENGYSENS